MSRDQKESTSKSSQHISQEPPETGSSWQIKFVLAVIVLGLLLLILKALGLV
ncbi:MAG: hypothetical protein HY961_04380 [Ignavibacteriae bacterium]|nr:hypothetical protein [Ignavibacteriota bacterium]